MSGKTLREALSAIGVIVSLLFVGLELRQNTLAVRATALNDLATGARELLLTIGSDSVLVASRMLWAAGEEMDPVRKEMTQLTLLAALRTVENVFLQVQSGVVDEAALQRYGFRAPPYSSSYFAPYWASLRATFDPTFVAAFEAANGL